MNSWIAAVLNSFWQAFAIAACVRVVLKFAPRANAATRHVVWWAVLGVVILLPGASMILEKSRIEPKLPEATAGAGRITAPPAGGPVGRVAMPPVRTRPAAPIEVRPSAWLVILPLVWLAAVFSNWRESPGATGM